MWQVLFLVSGMTIAITVLALVGIAFIVALVYRRRPGFIRGASRLALGLAVFVYLAVLVEPVGGWRAIAQRSGRRMSLAPRVKASV
jgi:hypothetical protein